MSRSLHYEAKFPLNPLFFQYYWGDPGVQVALVLNLDPAERNRKSMMNYLTEYIRDVPLNSKAKQAMARNYAFHLQVRWCTISSLRTV